MKTLKSLSVLTAAVLSNSLSLNAASDAANKPNFVIIFCDDMGYGDLSCYGNPTIRTPNIDRMACEGMKADPVLCGGRSLYTKSGRVNDRTFAGSKWIVWRSGSRTFP